VGRVISLHKEEARLIQEGQQGKRQGQKALYERYAPAMLGLCRRYAANREDAEEMLSNGWIKVFKNLKKYEGRGSFEGWLKTIMVREALNFLRKQRSDFQAEPLEQQPLPVLAPASDHDQQEYLQALLSHLPEGYRTVFNLHVMEGYTHAEIAALLDISESTSRSQLHKARQTLQEQMRLVELKTSRHEK